MRYTVGAGTYFGIPVRIHWTFPLVLAALGAEARIAGTWADAVRVVGLVAAVFLCVVLHEFGHGLAARRYGIKVRDIVLLPIGGMARAERIPERPGEEIVVALAGPAVNFALAALLGVTVVLVGAPATVGAHPLTDLLAVNLVIATFNLTPAYPMDGGRVLRALLALRFPYRRATAIARAVGQSIAQAFVVIGFVELSFAVLPLIAVFIFVGAAREEQMICARPAAPAEGA
jgi:Zn-dependent protease